MASQSLVLVQLFCFVMLARHSACWDVWRYKCYHSLRYHEADIETSSDTAPIKSKNIDAFVDYLHNQWDWKLNYDTVKTFVELTECNKDASCETFRCKKENGDDIFVLNGCALKKMVEEEERTQCTLHNELSQFCNTTKYPRSFSSCSQCYGKACNEKKINLKRPADASPMENHCIHAFRHNKSYEPDPALKDMMKDWQISNFTLKDNLECLMGNVGCQTYRCKNAFGNDIFVVNGCATKDEQFKCVYDKLDPFCLPQRNMYDHCEYCEGPSCNLNKIELETLYLPKSVGTKRPTTRSTKGTTTTEELDNETDESESTKRSKKIVASTKRTRRPKTSKRPSSPETPAINAAAAPHPSTMPVVLLPFCCLFRKLI